MFQRKETQLLAFHLPQYHPIPENDAWWGKGFTEWTNVVQGRPLFRGHYQPHLPADLGFYDLRLPEVREQQAELARDAGLGGFVHYHYWFNGRRLLERPVDDILRLKQPNFPFCLCWANEPWSRNWDGLEHSLLMPQSYSEEDDLAHIRWLLAAFSDDRYIKIDGKPLLLIYRPSHLPDMRRTADVWRREAERLGFPGLMLCAVRAFIEEFCDAATFGLDASVEFKPNGTDCGPFLKSDDPLEIGYRLHRMWEYDGMVKFALSQHLPEYPFFPSACPSWDNAARRKRGGMIFRDATPDKYGAWLTEVLKREALREQKHSLVFVNAWNEWAEGNHLEPCRRWGHAYLDATRAAVESGRAYSAAVCGLRSGDIVEANAQSWIVGCVDHRGSGPTHDEADGWCLDAETLAPPDLLVCARRRADGSYEIESPVSKQKVPRPDVADVKGMQAILAGWRNESRRPADPTSGSGAAEQKAVLAFRARDRSFAVVTHLN